MTSLMSSFDKLLLALAMVVAVGSSGCVHPPRPPRVIQGSPRVAVFPIENLSATNAPLRRLRARIIARLKVLGVAILDQDRLDRFMAKHRVRYVGGVDRATAQALQTEGEVSSVLVTSVEFYTNGEPPKIAMTSRLVSTGEAPEILWIDSVGLAGDDSPGLLDLGLVNDPIVLEKNALDRLLDSLVRHLSGEARASDGQTIKSQFRPKVVYRSPSLNAKQHYRVAVVPFTNNSERRHAGTIVALHFARQMASMEAFSVVEPGLVREEMLKNRVIMPEGISLEQSEALFRSLNADLILAGRLMDYKDSADAVGIPVVGFSVLAIAKNDGLIQWASKSYNRGNDGVYFFDLGRARSANAVVARMALAAGRMMIEP